MSKKIVYCTLDTETVGGACKPTGTYDIGGVIHDARGQIYATFSILVMEHFDKVPDDSYAKKNFPLYMERLLNGEITCVPTEQQAVDIVRNLCRFYGVRYVTAYNAGFDFKKTVCRELLDEFEFIDIWQMAVETVTQLKGYRKFCADNGFTAWNGERVSTKAEKVYGFVVNDADYEEEHTALQDALIEMAIFKRCYAMHKKFSRNTYFKLSKNAIQAI